MCGTAMGWKGGWRDVGMLGEREGGHNVWLARASARQISLFCGRKWSRRSEMNETKCAYRDGLKVMQIF